jgi:hypothetical protein
MKTRECFCGCGREIGRKLKTLNRVGESVQEQLDIWEHALMTFREKDPENDYSNLETWADTARQYRDNLREQVHAGKTPPDDKGFEMRNAVGFVRQSSESLARARAAIEGSR